MKTKDIYHDVELTGSDSQYQKVILHQQQRIDRLKKQQQTTAQKTESIISASETLLQSLGKPLPSQPELETMKKSTVTGLRTWEEILRAAERDIDYEVSLTDILPENEIFVGQQKLQAIRDRYNLEHRLDVLDWGIAGVAGTLAALVDIFLVQVPSSKGLLGGVDTQGGVLSDKIRKQLRNLYSPDQISQLEDEFWVPYDASTSRKLAEKVAGLGPRSHRFQSLGHDPVLGFIFGVLDIMKGRFSAIDKTGKLIVQAIPGAPSGIGLFEAFATQLGHLKSDIATAAGLPAPFMPLFQFLQFGNIDGRTVGELSRTMYTKGYDFGHFLAMSIPVAIIEVVVRLFYFAKRLHEGYSFLDALPINIPGKSRKPKLQTMLFTAHTIATAANAGKVYFAANPLGINLPQWLWFIKNSYHQLKWAVWIKENERLKLVQETLDDDWQHVNDLLLENFDVVAS